jgi:hypothetical protein
MDKTRSVLIILFLFLGLISYSQEKYEYIGVLTLDNNYIVPYNIFFTVDNGKVLGYSLTDMLGDHETKNEIEGTYNRSTKEFQFVEKNIIYTKSTITQNDFCFVSYKGKLKLENEKAIIKGDFIGVFNDNDKCAVGTIKLIGSDKLYKKLKKLSKKIKKTKRIDSVTKLKVDPIKMLDSLMTNRLKNGENTSVFWKSNVLKMDIWDLGKEDGDKISIFVNGKKILDNYIIMKKHKTITFPLIEGIDNQIIIRAENIGTISPNTARVELIDVDKRIKLNTSLTKDGETKITVIKLK